MKRFAAILLTLILLAQALPLNALAAVGHVLTKAELAAAWALTGIGAGSAQSNATYHRGMTPNETWNAMQVSDWLDDMLDTKVHSVQDTLSRASTKMAALRENDPKGFAYFIDDDLWSGVIDLMKDLCCDAEALRETMRYQQDRIDEQAGIITEFARQLEAEGDTMYASERARLSAKIQIATAELKAARKEVSDNAEQWQALIRKMQNVLDTELLGGDVHEKLIGSYLMELFAYGEEDVENTATVNVIGASSSRMGRLSANGSVLSNDAQSEIHVITENEIGFQIYTGKLEEKMFIPGVRITLWDLDNERNKIVLQDTDDQGRAFFETNQFVVSEDKTVHVRIDVDGERVGYRSFGVEDTTIKLGQLRKECLKRDDGQPYIYSASFKQYDIMREDFDMLYSDMNDMDFEIDVEVRSPGGGSAPAPMFAYWQKDGIATGYQQHWATPDRHNGNKYTFVNQWKRILTPYVSKEQLPLFAFSKDGSAERFTTRIKAQKGVVDSPLEKGGKVFMDVLGEGFSFKFKIPVVGVDVAFELPVKKYLPKIQVDLAGYVTITMGSPLFEDQLDKSKLNWKNQELKELSEIQKDFEKKGFLANYKTQFAIASMYYRENTLTFLMESKIKFGAFVALSGRWQTDNQVEDAKLTTVKVRGALGVTMKYSFSWTMRFALGPVPFYVCFTLGITASFAISGEVGFSWVNGAFHDWKPAFKDVIVNLGFSFTAQAGVGIKGFLDFWLRFIAAINIKLAIVIMGDEKSMISGVGSIDFTTGVTLFFVTLSKTWVNESKTLFEKPLMGNALPPLQQYVLANADAPEEIIPASQEPSSYPQLVPAAKTILSNQSEAHSTIKVGTSNGHTFAFYLDKMVDGYTGRTHQSVCWVDVNTGKKGNTHDYLNDIETPHSIECDDYDFDVWSDGNAIIVVACCADQFDDNGYPAVGGLVSPHAYAYIMPMGYWADDDRLERASDSFAPREASACNLNAAYNPRGLVDPHIEWAKVDYESYSDLSEVYISSVELYGFAERIDDGSGEKGYACFEYTGGKNFHLMSDMAIKNALGDDHERVNLRSSVRGHSGAIDAVRQFRCFGFVALSQPKEGVEGESAIELFDWEMNSAPVTFETRVVRPTVEVTLTSTKRQAIAVKKGDIGGFEMVQTVGAGGDSYAQTLFYTEAETDGDGAKAYRLKGLHIGNKQGALTRNLSYDITDYTYDITVPSSNFKVQTVNGTPFIYWLSTVSQEADGGPEIWRLWVSMYDPATNTVSTPAVYSEFSLQSGTVPRDVVLTAEGQGYLTVTPTPKDGDKKPQPMTLYSFPLTLKPALSLKGMIVEETTVSAGDFEDTTVALMNEGNMGISAFDLELYTQEGGKVQVVETLHCDCLNPKNNRLTMHGERQTVTLPEGRQVIYRNSDFDYTARQRDWMLGEKNLKLIASQGNKDDAWTGSVSERDSSASFVQTNMLMPGALASFTGTLKIPESWSGNKTLYLRISRVSAYANWQGAMANAAGLKANNGISPNAAATTELTWALDGDGSRLTLQTDKLASNAAFANAVRSGAIANTVDAGEPVALDVSYHDIEITHRVYPDGDGSDMLDIVVSNYADTADSFRLTCAVYLDDAEEPYYISLPYDEKALARRTTQTITLPVAALVDDPSKHNKARLEIGAVGRTENAYANNEFTVFLGGENALRFTRQPVVVVIQPGEDAAFEVAVEGGATPYAYQWQVYNPDKKQWVDLKGYTTPAIARESVEKEWDGAQFRCVVKDASGASITSEAATLTVRDRMPTGDDSHLALYLIVALAALTLLFAMNRKKVRR